MAPHSSRSKKVEHSFAQTPSPHGSTLAMALGAVGVVFGDIGTSPLYAINEIFFAHKDIAPAAASIVGCISLLLWTLTAIIAFKYVIFVMRADNDGEGGVFALYALLYQDKKVKRRVLLLLLILAAGLLFGDGVITPAISVLSAVEGLIVAAPFCGPYVVPITLLIITVLFWIQRKGTAKMGNFFGPIILVWLVAIGYFGAIQVFRHPGILAAFNPLHGVRFLRDSPLHASLLAIGGIMLSITGGEALYADMGHFGKTPIRLSWFAIVYPALVLNYLGQGAYLLSGDTVYGANIFFSLIPHSFLFPMVILATLATTIASQALISGAFSLAAQATALGLFPRLKIVHTHHQQHGQIYVPFINWSLYVGCIYLVVRFSSSTALAAAYGLAVAGVMLATSLALIPVCQIYWKWSRSRAWFLFGTFALIDLLFLLSNSIKFLEGGYIPLAVGAVLFVIMVTWRWGRKATFSAYSSVKTMKISELLALKESCAHFLERNVILMVPRPLLSVDDNTPALFQLFWDRYQILPRNLVFLEVMHRKVPYIHGERYRIMVFQKKCEQGSIVSVTVNFGFLENPNVELILEGLARHHEIDLPSDPRTWIIHGSLENILPTAGMSRWTSFRLKLFGLLRQIARPGHYYYGLGNDVNLTLEILPVKLR